MYSLGGVEWGVASDGVLGGELFGVFGGEIFDVPAFCWRLFSACF